MPELYHRLAKGDTHVSDFGLLAPGALEIFEACRSRLSAAAKDRAGFWKRASGASEQKTQNSIEGLSGVLCQRLTKFVYIVK